MKIDIIREYNYSDVYLVPNKCIVESRSECDTSIIWGGYKFDLPIVPANMPAVVDESTCKFLCKNNIFYVMHRFNNDPVKFVDSMQSQNYIASISIGVNEESYKQLQDLKNSKLIPEFITVDIAYAFSPKAEKMIKTIKNMFPTSYLCVGNITTPEGVEFITNCGADAGKLFIGPGAACTTKNYTGFTRPTVSTILDCMSSSKIPLIPDGGIREIGDIAKAICASGGSTMVMVGSIMAGFFESSGDIVELDGKKYKEYFGNASQFAKKHDDHIEGKKILVEYKGYMTPFIKLVKESLQSSISYAGGKNLDSLANCRIVAIN